MLKSTRIMYAVEQHTQKKVHAHVTFPTLKKGWAWYTQCSHAQVLRWVSSVDIAYCIRTQSPRVGSRCIVASRIPYMLRTGTWHPLLSEFVWARE